MFFTRLKNCISSILAVVVACAALFFVQALQGTPLAGLESKRFFYLQSPSSQAVIKENVALWELFEVEGESVVFPCQDREETLATLLHRYQAEICFQEEAGGSISYYCFTPNWQNGVQIKGVFVNLHIAFNGENCAVGTPIIFGGF